MNWNKDNMLSMFCASMDINETLLKLDLPQDVKNILQNLHKDMVSHVTETCDVCGLSHNKNCVDMNHIEFIEIRQSWGYFSNYDEQQHSLTLCCNCYDKHLMGNDVLKKCIKVKEYL